MFKKHFIIQCVVFSLSIPLFLFSYFFVPSSIPYVFLIAVGVVLAGLVGGVFYYRATGKTFLFIPIESAYEDAIKEDDEDDEDYDE